MRYFLDTEFNAFCGPLISIALVPEFGDREYYAIVEMNDPVDPWVERHVMPYLDSVPPGMMTEALPRETVAHELSLYLAGDSNPVIVADWPEDIAHFCSLVVTGPAELAIEGSLGFEYVSIPGFSTAENSRVPHNALHDARALRDFLLQWSEA
jgi:hypothetical protein